MPDADQIAGSWVELYRSVLRLRPVLERPVADANTVDGLRVHGEFCNWLRCYLLSDQQTDEIALLRYETEAAIERENWHALWSITNPTTPSPSDAR